MPVKAGNEELWLGAVEASLTTLVLHEAGRLLAVPRGLGLIVDGDVIDGRRGIGQPVMAKVVDTLD